MSQPKPKRIFGMTCLQFGIVAVFGGIALIFVCIIVSGLLANRQPTTSLAISPSLAPAATSSQDSSVWIIYEVVSTGLVNSQRATGLTVTYSNNTGGTDQNETITPFRAAYTARVGEVFSIIAQKTNDVIVGGLDCRIYLADSVGAHCLVDNGESCGKIIPWKASSCTGQFCVCQTSGMVGSGQ